MSDGNVTEIFHGQPRTRVPRNPLCEKMERAAGIMGQNFADDLAGYIVIGISKSGDWSIGYATDQEGPLGTAGLAGMGVTAIHRDMIAENQIKDALIRNGLVSPDPPEPAA